MTNRNQNVEISQRLLISVLRYDPTSGEFRWKETRNGFCKKGSIAGILHKKGYIDIQVFGQTLKAHRLAWLYVYGQWPDDQLDHVNGNRSDNRICNIRQATNAENQWNSGIRKDSTTGVRGVKRQGEKFIVRIQKNKKRTFLGSFDCLSDAAYARKQAEKELFGKFLRDAA